MNCCLCNEPITSENKSEEHIIHNAIGGTLKSCDIYCKKCNESYGSKTDSRFAQIFTPIIDNLDMHFDRATGHSVYTGIMADSSGKLYQTNFKNKKVVSMFDNSKSYVNWDKNEYHIQHLDFKFDNDAFKEGMAKIAFNYAVYNHISPENMERLFDTEKNMLVSKPVIIPFIPLTLVDSLIEAQPDQKLFHALRLFNVNRNLYVYIELFSTFQYYVLVSENFSGDVDKSYAQYISKNTVEKNKEKILEMLKIADYKDLDIICSQYKIDPYKVQEDLKKYHSNDKENIDFFSHIEKIAYEKLRKEAYEIPYEKILKNKFDSVDFMELLHGDLPQNELMRFYKEFNYYTIYDEDTIYLHHYKRCLEDNSLSYPEILCLLVKNHFEIFKIYGHYKFNQLMSHINLNPDWK